MALSWGFDIRGPLVGHGICDSLVGLGIRGPLVGLAWLSHGALVALSWGLYS